MALLLLYFFSGNTAVSHLPLAVGVAGLLLVTTIGCLVIGFHSFAVFGLVYSVPFSLMHHFVYLPNTGAADGLTVQLIDIWIILLLIHYVSQRIKGTAKPVYGFVAFCIPLTLMLVADLASIANSTDMELSFYGILNHLRAAALLIVLAVTLAQGEKELLAARLGILCAVVTVGGICIGEMIFQTNIRTNLLVDQMSESIFRAGGLDGPTLAAGYLAALLPLVAIEYFCPISRLRKGLAAVGLCLGIAGLGCTLTRAAFGFLVVGSIPLLIFLCRRRRIRGRHIILCLSALALLQVALGKQISVRLDDSVDNLNGRVALMQTALNMASNSPLIGQGINTYELNMGYFFPKDQTQDFEYVVHNKFLLTLAETGPLGLVSIVWLFGIALIRVFSIARRGSPLGIGLLCSLIIVALDMNVEIYEAGAALLNAWILIAISAALLGGEWALPRDGVRRLPLPNEYAGRQV